MEFNHYSVLLEETIDNLNIDPNGIYVDGTLGGAGHSLEIAKRLESGRLIGIDRDSDAIAAAKERLKEYEDKVTIVKGNFADTANIIKGLGIDKVNGIVLDLGVSSYQLDQKDRGFSYMSENAPLDMRMDRDEKLTAEDIINDYSYEELVKVLRVYGEERFAPNIVKNICKRREIQRITTTGELVKIIDESIPVKNKKRGGHPSKRTFQALRIELNGELDILEKSINDMIELLDNNGIICIISFHSLEDRIVKNVFKENERPCTCPKEFPVCVCGRVSKGEVVTRKPILPSDLELSENSRSRSAKLRCFKRCVLN
ncbi:MAG: 16S rRNA (cytosine(1402)-N(4))-methyltransferase RsmH [Lachnospiraceae bacterium]|nr:16S rRNA (cytosine(1402)-N(4))-methyltransferase RsmH [Lachnospiraceae bacterium]